jgi:UDP-N-acetylglucosamine--N-acetylmuramyl-(pentapeptide) pyrophosphoryl-undecaprenol N-acetylglucosamine transferase
MGNQMIRVVIACGGTGGHLFPGLAVAQVLKDRGHDVLLLVSEKAIDAQALKAHPEFRSEKLPSVGLPSVLSPAFISFLARTWESVSQCKHIYRRFKPDAVLAMGGFTSTAPLVAGRLGKIPTFVHESNAIPGKANKMAAKFVSNVLLGFNECAKFFPGVATTVTGTPVRKDLGDRIARDEAIRGFNLDPSLRTLVVMGGSQGASGINQLLIKASPMLASAGLQIIHLTGERDDRLAAANYLREGIPAYVSPFHHAMQEVYSAADIIVSRAGASSLSETAHFGIASILIPYPYAAEDHQARNAEIFVCAGAAEMLLESEASAESLAQMVLRLLGDDDERNRMALAARSLATDDSASVIATALENAART